MCMYVYTNNLLYRYTYIMYMYMYVYPIHYICMTWRKSPTTATLPLAGHGYGSKACGRMGKNGD